MLKYNTTVPGITSVNVTCPELADVEFHSILCKAATERNLSLSEIRLATDRGCRPPGTAAGDGASRLNRSSQRRVLAQRQMRPATIVVLSAIAKHASEMAVIEDDDVVKALTPGLSRRRSA
jgi:hypothetical protein